MSYTQTLHRTEPEPWEPSPTRTSGKRTRNLGNRNGFHGSRPSATGQEKCPMPRPFTVLNRNLGNQVLPEPAGNEPGTLGTVMVFMARDRRPQAKKNVLYPDPSPYWTGTLGTKSYQNQRETNPEPAGNEPGTLGTVMVFMARDRRPQAKKNVLPGFGVMAFMARDRRPQAKKKVLYPDPSPHWTGTLFTPGTKSYQSDREMNTVWTGITKFNGVWTGIRTY